MKKFVILLGLIVIYIFSYAGIAQAMDNYGKWFMPKYLKTYIQPGHSRTIMMKHAFSEWSRLTKNKFIFYYVDNPKLAQIEVYFVSIIPNADREIGLTTTSRLSSKKMTHAKILIADKTSKGKKLGNDAVYTVMLHEIGHAMGILEHSKEPLSIMYPTENDAQEIQKSDLKNLSDIYGW